MLSKQDVTTNKEVNLAWSVYEYEQLLKKNESLQTDMNEAVQSKCKHNKIA